MTSPPYGVVSRSLGSIASTLRWEGFTVSQETDFPREQKSTLRVDGRGWLEVRLPGPLAHLANRPHGRYRLSCRVEFPYRGDEVAAQAATGAVRYDISYDPGRGRWYLDASWRAPARPVPAPGELRAQPVLAVDLNHGHLAAWSVTPDGNPAGQSARRLQVVVQAVGSSA